MMTFCSTEQLLKETSVGMGQAVLAGEPTRLTAILGSCVAIALYAPRLRLGMLGHVVLPRCNGNSAKPAKFADTAVPHMLSALVEHGAKPRGLVAKIAGGACMFGDNSRFMDIGQSNTRAVIEALAAADVPLVGQDTAGTSGRRICFDLATGLVAVETTGRPSQTI